MNMVAPNDGKLKLLDWQLANDGSALPDLTLHLYQNNYTPVNGSVLGDFTESTFTGYATVAVLRSDFGAPAIVSNVAYTTCGFVPTFTCSGGSSQSAYGWYLTSDDDNTVVYAQKFDAVRTIVSGSQEKIDPFKIAFQTLH